MDRFNSALLWQPLDLDANVGLSKSYLLASVTDNTYCEMANKSMQRTYAISVDPEAWRFEFEAFAARVGAIHSALDFIPIDP